MEPSDDTLRSIEAFQDFSSEQCDALRDRLRPQHVARGDVLVRQGDSANALYLIITGRFEVQRDGEVEVTAEIGAGRPIGEIAFFTGGTRTANVRAKRDSLVYRLSRQDFEALTQNSKSVWPSITAALARRLTRTTAGASAPPRSAPHTIAICPAGDGRIPEAFIAKLREILKNEEATIVLDSQGALRELSANIHAEPTGSDDTFTGNGATQWFNDLESRNERIFFIADNELTAWTEKALHQADMVLFVANHDRKRSAVGLTPNKIEQRATVLHRPADLRLCLVHKRRTLLTGTRNWLARRPWIPMHHHVALDTEEDMHRLMRFLNGRARGLVACGGGAFTAAHIGLYQALTEQGYTFDIMGGTSGGAAMTAAFAVGVTGEELERRTHDMFVNRRALRRWTWPRYGLLDHTEFDASLEEHYTNRDIEDLWIPYFAISTNLSSNKLHCHRTGPLWRAIRASAAIPALLPPVFTARGEMLVDGCLLDNVPVKTMHELKDGPNVVLNLAVPPPEKFFVDHKELPSRWHILAHMLLGPARKTLPKAPGPQTVLMRSLLRNERDITKDLGPEDMLLSPPIPEGINVLDWRQHSLLRWSAYDFARAHFAAARKAIHTDPAKS